MADKSQLIQHLEAQSSRWQTLAEIKAHVTGIPDRTLRRWLAALVQQGRVDRTGERKGTQYRWHLAPPGEVAPIAVNSDTAVFTAIGSLAEIALTGVCLSGRVGY